ncbi:uncharacterized protein WM277_015719 [Molossus nigricans]
MARRRLLLLAKSYFCSGRDGGGAGGDVAPRAPGASVECGLGRGAAAASCRRDARWPGRAPRAAFVRCPGPAARARRPRPPPLGGARAGTGTRRGSLSFSRKRTLGCESLEEAETCITRLSCPGSAGAERGWFVCNIE